jgi:hypothetical protein
VPIGDDPAKFLWTHGEGTTYTSQSRLKDITHSYRAERIGWLGWPTAFGGADTPYSDKAYISWRVKTDGDIENYKVVGLLHIDGTFKDGPSPYAPGERIKILSSDGREFIGRVVHIDKASNRMHIQLAGVSSSNLSEAVVKGLESGAEASIDSKLFYRSSSPGKYFRSYETLSEGGSHIVLTTNRLISAQYSNSGQELRRAFEFAGDSGYGAPQVSSLPGWTFMEAYIDLSKDMGHGYISANHKESKSFKGLFIGDSKPKDAGPTISNIGWEPAGGTKMVNSALSFGEIYFDSTPQRVALSNSNLYSNVEKDEELQFIKTWSNNEISVEFRKGGLNEFQPIYIYVFDKNNNPNKTGFCFINCDNNYSPPKKIDLLID